jgi:hypothetical protein
MSEEKVPTIEQVHTACVDCVFAEVAGQTQTGCSFGRIDAYKQKGAEIIDAYDEHNNEFTVINGKICLYKRIKEWGKLVPKKKWKDTVLQQLKLRYHTMVLLKPEDSLESLHKTLESLNSQTNPPALVSILSSSKMTPSEIVHSLNSKEYDSIEWRLQTFLEEEMHERQMIDLAIDTTKNQVKIVFYMVFNSGFKVPNQVSDELQQYFIEDMQHAIFAEPREDGNGMLVNYAFHSQHAGNSFLIKIEDKLREFEEGAEDYFRNIEDICPSLKM